MKAIRVLSQEQVKKFADNFLNHTCIPNITKVVKPEDMQLVMSCEMLQYYGLIRFPFPIERIKVSTLEYYANPSNPDRMKRLEQDFGIVFRGNHGNHRAWLRRFLRILRANFPQFDYYPESEEKEYTRTLKVDKLCNGKYKLRNIFEEVENGTATCK